MWFVYILYSKLIDKYYTGYTHDIAMRIERHNQGWGNFTSKANDWQLYYSEEFDTKGDAIKRENEIKRKKSRKYIESLSQIKDKK
ncbi:MAG: GIY-YIG nuclease family protein [Ignavibacteriaceae bacterium]|nr:GIY-YIG nuclease family protein [Ignavibacteriaceae bacterium]